MQSPEEFIEDYAGKTVFLPENHIYLYVPNIEEREQIFEEAIEDLHPDGMLEDGWVIVGVSGEIEDGEAVQLDGFLAVHPPTDTAIYFDEGSEIPFDSSIQDIEVLMHGLEQ